MTIAGFRRVIAAHASMPDLTRYKHLLADEVLHTVTRLSNRIGERFPESGLSNVSRRLVEVAADTGARSRWVARPNWPLRIGIGLLVLLVLVGAIAPLWALQLPERITLVEFVAFFEAAINDVVLIGAAIFFLVTLETRVKRERALEALHELRSIAHIIDMHQLTKDPTRMLHVGRSTPSSPERSLSFFELERYLDYCSELLSLTGKIAALYVQHFDDSVAVEAANDVEGLCTGLSQKIWQKIMTMESPGRAEPISS